MPKDKKIKSAGESPPENDFVTELETCQKERDEYLEGWKRARADYTNAQKIASETQKEFIQYAEERLLYKLLDLMDTFDEALRQKSDNGISMLRIKMLSILKEHNVRLDEVNPGDTFDHNIHDAISGEGDKIQIVAGQAYYIHDKLLRPARVIVGSEENNN